MSPGADQADSAGVPWAGRRFDHSDNEARSRDDDGSAQPQLVAVISSFQDGLVTKADVLDTIRSSRLLVPLVAESVGVRNRASDSDPSAELAIVTVAGPDGRDVLPVFGSVDAMLRWNPDARPVPVDARRAALAAVDDGTELVVLDPRSPGEHVLRRPAVWALARAVPWTPCYSDDRAIAAISGAFAAEEAVVGVRIEDGDPTARLTGPECRVTIAVTPGLDATRLEEMLARVRSRWAADSIVGETTDSLGITVVGVR